VERKVLTIELENSQMAQEADRLATLRFKKSTRKN